MPSKSPLVIGHRGAPGYRPEHTRSSYELALAMGVDAVEPDVVATKDGVLVVRHENEISGTTDVADHPEFADRRTTRRVDGAALTGWFTEDFTWEELSTLRCRERLPKIRSSSASFDGAEPILRLRDVLDLVRAAAAAQGREIGVVLEVKHATHFASIGLDLAPLIAQELRDARWAAGELPLIVESFESTVLRQLRAEGVAASFVYLIEAAGQPYDLLVAEGATALSYPETVVPENLDRLVGRVDGISVDKKMLLVPGTTLVADAHARGLTVFTWTCRPENTFLAAPHRGPGGKSAFGDYEAEWAVIARQGVDGVFVDHPDLGVAVFRA
ncbi:MULTISPECIES: glycerophosphodiester phosphodiesterase family protein [unclassified Microbacterium]|uniref:glycerophosphodiester phosphodiesterase family protein n=1 Tax=unclassified Microbacterium TaxID=2609290 RepID=UPI002469C378|nr:MULTISPECIES: glycerophosphodiester phosphodiesterase family protein [unclassified Microbacterium]MDH5133931.1 glycerophosphodiester phosphodiesterase family protein [Microbacterium sp. RD10]MDH5137462.1 glycerophosphodiester phosphodiesterase family protein [Microbacterium sp. RD11]MDH5146060.1 glycerophosphodiester phosphodiesterase family protein [Microbacterium sp. RD12]MDH5155598.1 glycerophosphodiester phosphodiesterase family protein [Microbacterium sp. RD06]MDH5166362.1 glycerophosp